MKKCLDVKGYSSAPRLPGFDRPSAAQDGKCHFPASLIAFLNYNRRNPPPRSGWDQLPANTRGQQVNMPVHNKLTNLLGIFHDFCRGYATIWQISGEVARKMLPIHNFRDDMQRQGSLCGWLTPPSSRRATEQQQRQLQCRLETSAVSLRCEQHHRRRFCTGIRSEPRGSDRLHGPDGGRRQHCLFTA